MAKREVDRAAESIADGEAIDWERLAASGVLTASELEALRLLEEVRSMNDAQPLEDGFELRGELGRGSMGRVYRAFDRSLQREVALKIVSAGGAASTRARFVEEARLLASLRHPGIVQVYSIHEHEQEIRMALELVEGRTLEEMVRTHGPFSSAETARIGVELCHALALLHERGITHRDLKPANVMREKGGRIVLLDFGIARSPGASEPLSGAGTPRFMSPEQFVGEEVGPRSDLWSLGALLYWLVSAHFPFEGARYEALSRAVSSGRPRALVDRRPDVDPRLAAIVARTLERDPQSRYQTAGELGQSLRALAALTSAAEPPDQRGHKRGSPTAWAVSMVTVTTAALLVVWFALRPRSTGLELHAELFARRGGADVRLRPGDTVAEGDLLVLESSCAEPIHLYVLDQDDAGEMHVLFPVPGFETQNPLPAGVVHRLPGKFRAEPQCWLVTSGGGGAENILIVASREPLPAVEGFLASLPPVEPTGPPLYPAVPSVARGTILRGIGGTVPEAAVPPASSGAARELERLASELAEQTDPDRVIRILRLSNR